MTQDVPLHQVHHFLAQAMNETTKKLEKLQARVTDLDTSLSDPSAKCKERKKLRYTKGKITYQVENLSSYLVALTNAMSSTEQRMQAGQTFTSSWTEHLPPILKVPGTPFSVTPLIPPAGPMIPASPGTLISPVFYHPHPQPFFNPHAGRWELPTSLPSTTGTWHSTDSDRQTPAGGWVQVQGAYYEHGYFTHPDEIDPQEESTPEGSGEQTAEKTGDTAEETVGEKSVTENHVQNEPEADGADQDEKNTGDHEANDRAENEGKE